MARIEFRIADDIKLAWEEKASDGGLSLSEMIRLAVEGLAVPAVRKRRHVQTDPELLRQLAQIGNNLNQLARWANRDRSGVEAMAVIMRLIEIDRELSALRIGVERGASHAD